jgi:hypothetical protein
MCPPYFLDFVKKPNAPDLMNKNGECTAAMLRSLKIKPVGERAINIVIR